MSHLQKPSINSFRIECEPRQRSCNASIAFDLYPLPVIGVRAPFDLGGGGGGGDEIIARKKLHNARKNVLCKRTQIALKQRRSQFVRLMNVLSFQNTVESAFF